MSQTTADKISGFAAADKAVGSDTEAIAILKECAKAARLFWESGYPNQKSGDPDHLTVVGFVIEGTFGVGDNFFEAMRWLRKAPR